MTTQEKEFYEFKENVSCVRSDLNEIKIYLLGNPEIKGDIGYFGRIEARLDLHEKELSNLRDTMDIFNKFMEKFSNINWLVKGILYVVVSFAGVFGAVAALIELFKTK